MIPGWRHVDELPPEPLLKKIRAAHRRGALCSICSGVFVLAAAGVLDGKTVTTHWRYAAKVAGALIRTCACSRTRSMSTRGQIITSAGSAAGLDMLLHLVRRDHGSAVANRVAQRLVVAPHREGGQAQFVPRPVPHDESGRLTRLMDWVRRSSRVAAHACARWPSARR